MTAARVEQVSSNGAGQAVDRVALSGARGELSRLAAMAGLVLAMIGGAIRSAVPGASAAAGGEAPHARRAPLIGVETGRKKFRAVLAQIAKVGPFGGDGAGFAGGAKRAAGGAEDRARAQKWDAAAPGRGALA
jgi:hypothetical protein